MREVGRFGYAGSREADAGGCAKVALQTAIGSFYAEGSLSGLLRAPVTTGMARRVLINYFNFFGGYMTAATAAALDKAMVGQPAPEVEMASRKNIEQLYVTVRLAGYRGRSLVMVFDPLDFTLVRATDVKAVRVRDRVVGHVVGDVVGRSTDSVATAGAWINPPRYEG